MRTKVFISYSHTDEAWLRRLQVHLESLDAGRLASPWDDTRIKPGQDWRREISNALDSAIVAVLLVSADFLASKFIKDNELPPLLNAAHEEGVTILPVILKPCRFRETAGLGHFQAVNDPIRPLAMLSEAHQEEVWVKAVNSIEAALRQSSPEARQEAELGQIQAELRSHSNTDPVIKEAQRMLQNVRRDPTLSAMDKEAYSDVFEGQIKDSIVIYLMGQIAECQKTLNAGVSAVEARRLNNRIDALDHEIESWNAVRFRTLDESAELAKRIFK